MSEAAVAYPEEADSMCALRIFFALALIAIADGVLAQATPPPKAMSGSWTAVVPGRQTFTDSMSVVLEAPAGTGAVTGRLTVRGLACSAVDEPLTGTWDGTELRFESVVRPNVNAQRMNGECGNGRVSFVLKRKPGRDGFEGESQRDGSPVTTQISLSP